MTDHEGRVRRLVAAMRGYIAALPGPGVAEVLEGLARWENGPVRPVEARANRLAGPLAEGLGSLAEDGLADLADAIADAAPLLGWITYDRYPHAEIGEAFRTGHAYASVVGIDGPIAADDYDLGLFVIAPGVLYRDHHHAAPELYAPLTGPHRWRFAPGDPLISLPAHTPVWNPSLQPHATLVGARPFVCIFGWTRDVLVPARVIPATDWAEIEAEGRRTAGLPD